MTRPRQAIRQIFQAVWDSTDNQPPLPAIFPDQLAPVVHVDPAAGSRTIVAMRWGFPPPPDRGTRPITNIRNTTSPYWRRWLARAFRCLVPATSFCEYTDSRPKTPYWFALGPDRPPFAFAGLWRPWTGTRKGETGEHRLFAFLTTDANEVVRPVHARAMPVILTEEADWQTWLEADPTTALALQRPLAADRLMIVGSGRKQDDAT
jgi:putative SOS response-associated peptidase YedK